LGWAMRPDASITVATYYPPSIEVRPTALAWPLTLTSIPCDGHDLLACKSSRLTVSRFWR